MQRTNRYILNLQTRCGMYYTVYSALSGWVSMVLIYYILHSIIYYILLLLYIIYYILYIILLYIIYYILIYYFSIIWMGFYITFSTSDIHIISYVLVLLGDNKNSVSYNVNKINRVNNTCKEQIDIF